MFLQSVPMFFKELVWKTGEADELQLSWGHFYDTINFTEMKWNEICFSLKITRLIFKSSIWSILSTSLMVSLWIQLNCLFSLPEMIAFLFPRIIYLSFLQMKAGAFSQRQQFPYFRNSLLKLGQSCERHLNFYKRKEGQVNLIVNSLSFSA